MGALGAILIALGIVAAIFGLIKKSQAKRLLDAPVAKTGEVASKGDEVAGNKGAVSVEGDVTVAQPLKSPVTGTECLYYELKVVGTWKDGDSTKSKDYIHEKVAAAFTIDDGSGPVPVDAGKGGDFDTIKKTHDETKREGMFADLKSAVGKGEPIMFGEYAFENPPMSKADKFQCIEKVVPLSDRLFVSGKHEAGVITTPGWKSLLMSSKTYEEFLGATNDIAKKAFIGGGVAAGVGALLGIIGALMG